MPDKESPENGIGKAPVRSAGSAAAEAMAGAGMPRNIGWSWRRAKPFSRTSPAELREGRRFAN